MARVFAFHRPVHRLFFLNGEAEGFRKVRLTVHVDSQHALFLLLQGRSQIDGGGRLSDPPLWFKTAIIFVIVSLFYSTCKVNTIFRKY